MPETHTPLTGGASPWSPLSDTQRTIVLTLLRHGRMSRARIMEEVGISLGSITRLTAPLIEQGLLVSHVEQVAATGRPQSPLEVRADAESLVGVNLTSRFLMAVLTDLRLRTQATVRLELEGHSPTEVASQVVRAVEELRGRRGDLPEPACLGLSLGGASHDGRVVAEAVFLGWHQVPLARMLEERLGLPTSIGNDLKALTLREAWFGAGREVSRFMVVTVGAGVGYGLGIDGQAVSTHDSELGLVGTVPVPDGARPAHAVAAMDCLTDTALERAWAARSGTAQPAAHIVEMAAQGQVRAVEVCASFARRLGRFVGIAAAFTMPESVVVAGERAKIAALFEDQVMVGVAAVRRGGAHSLGLVVREHDRREWAGGAATLALNTRILGEPPTG